MKIKVTSDSTCDLSPELLAQYEITLLPLHVLAGEEDFLDGVTMQAEDVFARAQQGVLCRTACVNEAEYSETFRTLRQEYDAVIHICLSSELSGCFLNATLAAEEVDGVFVVDSLSLCTGQGLLVLRAARLARQGLTPEEICACLREMTGRVETSFLLDRLDYIHRGGRCTSVEALGANLLRLRPCVEMTDGKLHVGKKYRGSMEKCVRDYVKDRVADRTDLEEDFAILSYIACSESVIQAARDALAEFGHFAQIAETTAGCTISSHCGPGTLAVMIVRKEA